MNARVRMLLAVSLLAGAAVAQPPTPAPDKPKDQPPAPKAPLDPEQERAALKARLERRISEQEQSITKMKEAIARLNKGESPDSVVKPLEPWHRPNSGPDGPSGGTWMGRRPGGPPSPDAPKADAPDRDVVLGFLNEHNPEFAERLKKDLKENPASADRLVGRLAPHIREVLAERDPEMRSLRIAEMKNGWDTMGAFRKLVDTLRKDPAGDETKQAEAKARELLGAQFDLQVKSRNREITLLEERIGEIRKELTDKLAEREAYITQRIKFAQERAKNPPQRHEHGDGTPDPKAAEATKK